MDDAGDLSRLAQALQGRGWLDPASKEAAPGGPVGAPFGPYVLLERVGSGGMGVVWKAWDPRLRRAVALKQVRLDGSDPGRVERFRREARLAARLRHPHIVAVLDMGEEGGQPYFTCDLVDGKPLDPGRAGIPLAQAAQWIESVAEALQYAHERGVIHRDVKPGNILVDREGKAWITDFGLAKDLGPARDSTTARGLTSTGSVFGTPQYMSPEQARGDHAHVGPAGDQFSLGVVLYELLFGGPPFSGTSLLALLRDIAEHEPAPPDRNRPAVPADLAAICQRALQKDPRARYASVGEMAADLYRFRHGDTVRARTRTWAERAVEDWARRPARPAAALAAALVLALTAWVWTERGRRVEAVRRCVELGNRLLDRGDYPEAREAFSAALALEPDNFNARSGLLLVKLEGQANPETPK